MIELQNLTFAYSGHPSVFDGFELRIEQGEAWSVIGPSGCGKSTTLRMVAGLESATEGEIFIGDKLVNDVPPKGRHIAMVFQNYALYPHKDVYQNMAFGLKLKRHPKEKIDRRVQRAAKILGIEDLLHRRPDHLSGGQKQRAQDYIATVEVDVLHIGVRLDQHGVTIGAGVNPGLYSRAIIWDVDNCRRSRNTGDGND